MMPTPSHQELTQMFENGVNAIMIYNDSKLSNKKKRHIQKARNYWTCEPLSMGRLEKALRLACGKNHNSEYHAAITAAKQTKFIEVPSLWSKITKFFKL